MTMFSYEGAVLDRATRTGAPGLRVEAWDTRLAVGSMIGYDVTDASGRFTMSLTEEDVAYLFPDTVSPAAYFRVIHVDGDDYNVLASTERSVVWSVRGLRQQGSIYVTSDEPIGTERALTGFVVRGRVVHTDTGPEDGATVTLEDVNLGVPATELATGTTDSEGSFTLEFAADVVDHPGKVLPDVRLVVTDPAHTSSVRWRMPPTAYFDVVVGGTEYVRPSYAGSNPRLTDALGVAEPSSLNAEDRANLARSTGIPPRDVDALVAARIVAQALASPSEAQKEALFGLLRTGLPSTLEELARIPRAFFEAPLQFAQRNKLVSAAAVSSLPTFLEIFDDAVRSLALSQDTVEGTTSTLERVLDIVALGPVDQRTLFGLHLSHSRASTQADFWTTLEGEIGAGPISDLQLLFQWGSLARYHLPLMYRLKKLKDDEEAETLRDLAQYNESDWEAFLGDADDSPVGGTTVDYPEDTPGANDAEKRTNFAWTLTRTMELAFPTAAIGGKDRRANAGTHTPLSRFVANNPTFEFGRTRVHVAWESSPDLTGIDPGALPALKTRLLQVERLSRLTLKYEHIEALSDAGYKSARSVVRKGRSSFVAEMAGLAPPIAEGEASVIFDRAVKLAESATFLKLKFHAGAQGPILHALPDRVTISDSADPAIGDWATLFGSLDHCSCKHCMSVFGPAAYMVDLLQWLGQHSPGALTELEERRPDIWHVGLTCDNTDTALPYIDLVNEMLEYRIAVDAPASPIQTKSTTPELKATPEVFDLEVHGETYATLYNAVYPWSLPFHYWNEEARLYLNHLGVPRHTVMERLQTTAPSPTNLQIAQEYLGMSTPERAIIVGPPGGSTSAHWGMSSGSWSEDLLGARVLLNRSRLSYDELLELIDSALLESHALDAGVELPHLEAIDALGPCTLDNLTIAGLDPAALATAWGEVHRFLRLRRRLGWTIRDLDRTLTGLSIGLTNTLIEHLADIVALTSELDVPVVEALSWWGDLDTRATPSQVNQPSFYDTLFQNKAVQNPVDPAFAADSLTGQLSTVTAGILGGTRLSGGDYALLTSAAASTQLLDLPVVIATSEDLTVANLSLIHRHGSLARALDITMADLRALLALTGAVALTTGAGTATPATTRGFVERVQQLRRALITPAEAHYLIRHIERPTSGIVTPTDAHAAWLVEIQAGHDAIGKANAYVGDPSGVSLQALLLELVGAAATPPAPEVSREAVSQVMAIVRMTATGTKAEQATELEEALAFLGETDLAFVVEKLTGIVHPDPPNPTLEEEEEELRIQLVQEKVLSYRSQIASEALVVQALSQKLDVTAAIANMLLREWMTSASEPLLTDLMPGVVTGGTPTEAGLTALIRLAKAALVIGRLGLSLEELTYLEELSSSPYLALDDLAATTPVTLAAAQALYAKLERLFAFAESRQRLGSGPAALVTLLRAQDDVDTGVPSDIDGFFDRVSRLTNWNRADLEVLVEHFDYDTAGTFTANFATETGYRRLADAFEILDRLGTSASEALSWLSVDTAVAAPPTAPPASVLAVPLAAKRLAQAKHTEAAWPEIARKLRDPFRERQRDALVDHELLQAQEADVFPEVSVLYGDLLVDPEMAACQLTSRIKQTTGSIQQFIQRMFLNLESPKLGAEAATQWKWMRTYRVWEAARKVLLYPENWILPELRDDKSEPFQALESQLRQGELNQSTVEKAYRRFLDGLNEVARLDVISTFEEVRPGKTFRMGAQGPAAVHVLARTRSKPRKYFYRDRTAYGEWRPWSATDLDIPNDNCTLYVANGRTFIAWPLLSQQAVEGQSLDTPNELAKANFELGIASSERRDGAWLSPVVEGTVKKLTTFFDSDLDVVVTEGVRLVLDSSSIAFPTITGLTVFQHVVQGNEDRKLARYVVGRRGEPLALAQIPESFITFPHLIDGWDTVFCSQEREYELGGALLNALVPMPVQYDENFHPIFSAAVSYPILSATPSTEDASVPNPFTVVAMRAHKLAAGANDYQSVDRSTFFYRDRDHQYFVTMFDAPQPTWTVAASSGPSKPVLSHSNISDSSSDFAVSSDTMQWANSQPRTSLHTPEPHESSGKKFLFVPFEHQHVDSFLEALFARGPAGLREYPEVNPLQEQSVNNFATLYEPSPDVATPYPKDDVDFTWGGAYSVYNWELFFHAPYLIAKRLHDDGRHEEAHEWLRAIFDPTSNEVDPSPQCFWKVKPFRDLASLAAQQDAGLSPSTSSSFETLVLATLLSPASWDPSSTDWIAAMTSVGVTFEAQLEAWRDEPLNPHLIARMRPLAYMKATVMLYIDNLIGWGDQLFRRDTIESINEAAQLYVLAKEVLGPRPIAFSHQKHEGPVWTFNTLSAALDGDEVENLVPLPATDRAALENNAKLRGANSQGVPVAFLATNAFCLPSNEELSRYWDTVDDRLFKLHHCMNIEGIVRELPLFEPPIDPALLVQAAAAGVDLSSVLNDIQGGLPKRRFKPLWHRAVDIARDAAAFGAGLLANLERADNEHLGRLTATHESDLLKRLVALRKDEIDEAKEMVRALEAARRVSEARRDHYIEQRDKKVKVDEEVAFTLGAEARARQNEANDLLDEAAFRAVLPTATIGGAGMSSAVVTGSIGGPNMAAAKSAFAGVKQGKASNTLREAEEASRRASFERRWEEWGLQVSVSQEEVRTIDRQIVAAKVRVAIMEKQLDAHLLQIEQSKSRLEFLKTKFTREELYTDWLKDQYGVVFYECYKLAYDAAKLAERAYRFERAEPSTTFITFGYWDAGKKGLLAAERLLIDLRRMDAAFEGGVRRDYEIEKTVSLAERFPDLLLDLRRTGQVEIALDEKLFDEDHPGQYMRRLHSVGLSVSTLAGPHATINCRLTLLHNKLRKATGGTYIEVPPDDGRFIYDFVPLEAICTSTADDDIGMFTDNLVEDRLLPFQGAGAISTWRIELLPDQNAFDLRDVADVDLRVRYSAREGGSIQATSAKASDPAADRIKPRLLSLREEFPNEWHAFMTALVDDDQVMTLPFVERLFPFLHGTTKRVVDRLRAEVVWGSAVTTPEPVFVVEIENADSSPDTGTFPAGESLEDVEVDDPSGPLTGDINGDAWTLRIPQAQLADTPNASFTVAVGAVHKLLPNVIDDIWLVIDTKRA